MKAAKMNDVGTGEGGHSTTVMLVEMPGQLCNQLRILANVLAVSFDLGYRVYAPAFSYPSLLANKGKFCPEPSPRIPRFFPWVSPFLRRSPFRRHAFRRGKAAYVNIVASFDRRGKAYDLSGAEFRGLVGECDRIYLAGLNFRDFHALARHRDDVLALMLPREGILRAASAHVGELRSRYGFVLGVHVRRGDYKAHSGGRFFFSHADYARLVSGLLNRIDRADAAVMVCSDEPVDLDAYAGLNVFSGPGSAFDDLYALSMTDLIVGPPSTFSGWASFVGGVQKIEVVSAEAELDMAASFVSPC
jgi:hypothetical protein